ncbi:zinc finger protein ZAT9-like [Salvia hispanica]|uniref:zinc finger protein ZAT9-like n=1 Tax=Salvia hispanica TaxID=49212 RepID=UPI0020098583|nr:zinc finger protein ZAT9-like [Salvia hispanica]
MGQVEEQRYVCRICSKPCVSGKSLGGHMRAHLASKKSAVNPNCVEEFGDSDESKHALTAKTTNSCRECGKEFASLRALSGHMRFHSIKNKKEVHLCKECGRGFESIRAVFGHMKSHSTKKVSSVVVESFCPVRRKRSEIKYKGTVSANPSVSGVDASCCSASEAEEAEEAARCLVMLSRGVGSFSKLISDSDHSGGVVASNVSEFENGMGVDLVCDEGFLKDGIESNGCDDESCENGADLEMVEEKHRAMSSDWVEQEMGSGGSARGSLRGAASMRRCSSLLEMDAVAVIW